MMTASLLGSGAILRFPGEIASYGRAGEIAEFHAEAAIDAGISDWRKHTGA
jgi:hypothetical protein